MRHPSNLIQYVNDPSGFERAEIIEAHLEECQRCRNELAQIAGVDFDRVAQTIRSEINPVPQRRSRLAGIPGPAVAAAVFIFVLATGGLALWLGSGRDTGADVVDAPVTTQAATTTEAPLHFAERQSFELVWELDSGDVGHFLWIAEGRWSAVRLSTGEEQPEQRYRITRDMDNRFFSVEDDLLGPDDGLTVASDGSPDGVPEQPDVTLDPDIPYALLLEATTMDTWFEQFDGDWQDGAEKAPPTHPEAATAWVGGDHRIEFSFDGIPVLYAAPDNSFSVVTLERRKIDRIELQTNMSPPIAAWRSTITTAEQKVALADAWVSQQEWHAALAAAGTCSDRPIDMSATDEASADWFTPDCWERHAADIALVRGIQRDEVPWDQVEVLFYEMRDMDAMASVMAAEPGPIVELTAPSGVAFTLGKRGDGWCYSSQTSGSGTEACIHPDFWQAPGVFEFSPGWGSGGWGEVQGLAAPEVTSILLEYADGTTVLEPTFGHDAGLGAVAYYHTYNWQENGVVIAGSALDAEGNVIVRYDFASDYCSSDAADHREDDPVTDSMCGDGGE